MAGPEEADRHDRPSPVKGDIEAEAAIAQDPPLHDGEIVPPRPTRSRAVFTAIVRLSATQGGRVLKALSITSLLITALALWQAISSSGDAKKSIILAEWTAKKEFLEYCEAHSWQDQNCQDVRNMTLEMPPGVSPSVHGKRSKAMLRIISANSKITHAIGFALGIILLCSLVLGIVQVHLKYRSWQLDFSKVQRDLNGPWDHPQSPVHPTLHPQNDKILRRVRRARNGYDSPMPEHKSYLLQRYLATPSVEDRLIRKTQEPDSRYISIKLDLDLPSLEMFNGDVSTLLKPNQGKPLELQV